MSTNDKIWFITGASSGFGHAFASYAMAYGYCVVATAGDAEHVDALVRLVPDNVLAVKVNVTRQAEVGAAIEVELTPI